MAAPFLLSQTDPAHDIVEATQSDTANEEIPFRGIYIGTAGALKVTTMAGNDVTIPDGVLAAGVLHPIRIKRVWSTGTTATDIYGVI